MCLGMWPPRLVPPSRLATHDPRPPSRSAAAHEVGLRERRSEAGWGVLREARRQGGTAPGRRCAPAEKGIRHPMNNPQRLRYFTAACSFGASSCAFAATFIKGVALPLWLVGFASPVAARA